MISSSQPSIQFLSVCHYITSFSIFFIDNGLIKFEEQNQSIPVLNAFFQYLKQSNNESEAKIQLLQNIVNRTGFFSNRENGAHYMEHLNETCDYIINSLLFFHYGDIINSLAKLINSTKNITFAVLKENMHQHLSNRYITEESCSSSIRSYKLTALAVSKIIEDYIWANFVAKNIEKHINNSVKREVRVHERSKRQPFEPKDDRKDMFNENEVQSTLNEEQEADVDINIHDNLRSDIPISVENIVRDSKLDDSNLPFKKRKFYTGGEINLENSTHTLADNYDLGNNFSIPTGSWGSNDHFLQDISSEPLDLSVAKISKYQNILSPISSWDSESEDIDNVATNIASRLSDINTLEKFSLEFRIQVNTLAIQQANELWLHEPMDLWFIQYVTKQSVVESLKNLKGKTFFFNDITVLDKNMDHVNFVEKATKVHYNLVVDSQNGFVDLNSYGDEFKNKYITFPDVIFNVNDVHFTHNILTIALKVTKESLTQANWLSSRQDELEKLKITQAKGKTKRMQVIEKAADFISSNVLMHTFSKSVNMLKDYLLELEHRTELVPTYDDLAKDFSNNLQISAVYENFNIVNRSSIDDVLFDLHLDDTRDFNDFSSKLHLMNLRIGNDIKIAVFNVYVTSATLQDTLRIEDFVLLYMYLKSAWLQSEKLKELYSVAIYRLALRQCEMGCVGNQKTIHIWERVREVNQIYENIKRTGSYTCNFTTFSQNPRVDSILLNITMEMDNKAGLVNFNFLTGSNVENYKIAPGMTFPVNNFDLNPFNGSTLLSIKILDTRAKESKMVDLINKLNELVTKSNHTFNYQNQ